MTQTSFPSFTQLGQRIPGIYVIIFFVLAMAGLLQGLEALTIEGTALYIDSLDLTAGWNGKSFPHAMIQD